jgi:hypothetical protein
MIAAAEAERIASGWIIEYSEEAHVAKVERERRYFFDLDDLVYQRPIAAMLVFEAAARMEMSNWAFEGLAGGPIKEFLYLYSDRYAKDLDAISVGSATFARLRALAMQGLNIG